MCSELLSNEFAFLSLLSYDFSAQSRARKHSETARRHLWLPNQCSAHHEVPVCFSDVDDGEAARWCTFWTSVT